MKVTAGQVGASAPYPFNIHPGLGGGTRRLTGAEHQSGKSPEAYEVPLSLFNGKKIAVIYEHDDGTWLWGVEEAGQLSPAPSPI